MKLNEQEIKDILSQHINEKNRKGFFLEQAGDVKSQLQQFAGPGACISGGTVVTMKSNSTTPLPQNRQYAIEKQSKTPGKKYYFFIDFTFGYIENGKFVMLPKKWNCSHIEKDLINKTKSDAEATINNLKEKQNEYIGALTGETLNKHGVTYIVSPTEGEKLTLKPIVISSAPKELFPNGLTLWYNPSGQKNLKKDDTAIGKQLEDQQIDRNACRSFITQFYTSFKRKNSIVLDPASFQQQKDRTQACKDAYYNKWGVLGDGKKLDQYLDILSGNLAGGPTSYGSDSQWRIK